MDHTGLQSVVWACRDFRHCSIVPLIQHPLNYEADNPYELDKEDRLNTNVETDISSTCTGSLPSLLWLAVTVNRLNQMCACAKLNRGLCTYQQSQSLPEHGHQCRCNDWCKMQTLNNCAFAVTSWPDEHCMMLNSASRTLPTAPSILGCKYAASWAALRST